MDLKTPLERLRDNVFRYTLAGGRHLTLKSSIRDDYGTIIGLLASELTKDNYKASLQSIVNFTALFEDFVFSSHFTIAHYKTLYSKYTTQPAQPLLLPEFPAFDPTVYSSVTLELGAQIKKAGHLRLSNNYNLDLSKFSKDELLSVYNLINEGHFIKDPLLNVAEQNVGTIIFNYIIGREISKKFNISGDFYVRTSYLISILNDAEYKDPARNIAFVVLKLSLDDNVPEYGFFILFFTYARQGRLNVALLWGSLCLEASLKKGTTDKNLLCNIIWETLKLVVEEHISEFDFFKSSIPENLYEDFYWRSRFEFPYFNKLYKNRDNGLVTEALLFLKRYKKELFEGNNVIELRPWLSLIYSLQGSPLVVNHGSEYQELVGFGNEIEQIISRQDAFVPLGSDFLRDPIKAKEDFIEAFIRIRSGLHTEDYSYDLKSLFRRTNDLISYSFDNQDFEAFMIAMIVSADHQIMHTKRDHSEIEDVLLSRYTVKDGLEVYKNPGLLSKTILKNAYCLEVLSHKGKSIISVKLDNEVAYDEIDGLDKLFHWGEFFSPESLNPKQSRSEFLDETNKITDQLSFFRMDHEADKNILLIKDFYLSGFPHNLLLNGSGDFLSLNVSVTDIIGSEWLIHNLTRGSHLEEGFVTKMWIPILGFDKAVSTLYELFKKAGICDNPRIEINPLKELKTPLNGNINIVVAHGGDFTVTSSVLAINNNERIFSNNIVGKGNILILFVCAAGGVKYNRYSLQINSLVRRYLSFGYDAVIAPFWDLSIAIPPIWLPPFLDSLNKGHHVSEATLLANKAVFEHYPTPLAWACMHLYGNPYFGRKKTL